MRNHLTHPKRGNVQKAAGISNGELRAFARTVVKLAEGTEPILDPSKHIHQANKTALGDLVTEADYNNDMCKTGDTYTVLMTGLQAADYVGRPVSAAAQERHFSRRWEWDSTRNDVKWYGKGEFTKHGQKYPTLFATFVFVLPLAMNQALVQVLKSADPIRGCRDLSGMFTAMYQNETSVTTTTLRGENTLLMGSVWTPCFKPFKQVMVHGTRKEPRRNGDLVIATGEAPSTPFPRSDRTAIWRSHCDLEIALRSAIWRSHCDLEIALRSGDRTAIWGSHCDLLTSRFDRDPPHFAHARPRAPCRCRDDHHHGPALGHPAAQGLDEQQRGHLERALHLLGHPPQHHQVQRDLPRLHQRRPARRSRPTGGARGPAGRPAQDQHGRRVHPREAQ